MRPSGRGESSIMANITVLCRWTLSEKHARPHHRRTYRHRPDKSLLSRTSPTHVLSNAPVYRFDTVSLCCCSHDRPSVRLCDIQCPLAFDTLRHALDKYRQPSSCRRLTAVCPLCVWMCAGTKIVQSSSFCASFWMKLSVPALVNDSKRAVCVFYFY